MRRSRGPAEGRSGRSRLGHGWPFMGVGSGDISGYSQGPRVRSGFCRFLLWRLESWNLGRNVFAALSCGAWGQFRSDALISSPTEHVNGAGTPLIPSVLVARFRCYHLETSMLFCAFKRCTVCFVHASQNQLQGAFMTALPQLYLKAASSLFSTWRDSALASMDGHLLKAKVENHGEGADCYKSPCPVG